MIFEKLLAFRDAAFWWLGVWAAVTMGNNAVRRIIASRKERQRKDHEKYRKEFFAEIKRRHAEEDAETQDAGDFSRPCCNTAGIALLLMIFMFHGGVLNIRAADSSLGYETRLFDVSREHPKVHLMEIIMPEWKDFLVSCEDEQYVARSVVIDGERLENAGLRAKGNTSLANVRMMGRQRYSLKVEFDHYQSGKTYHGLDKLCLNNLIQDNTYMKDYLTFKLMEEFGAVAPLCSYVWMTVNGEPWGLFLAIEGVEDSFLRRNYGHATGALYKPDATGFGGGPGNGRDFNMEEFLNNGGQFPPPPGMGNPDVE